MSLYLKKRDLKWSVRNKIREPSSKRWKLCGINHREVLQGSATNKAEARYQAKTNADRVF